MNDTILIVDDEKIITEVLSNLIKIVLKCNVITSNEPLEAIKLLKLYGKKPDMIISDFLMPVMNGLDFLREAKELCPEAILIFLTGYADKENAIRGINELGIYQYLEKPWDDGALIKIIINGLEKKELKNKLEKRNVELQAANNELGNVYELMKKESKQEMDKAITVIASLINLIEQKDKEKVGHSRRVSRISESIGIKMGISNDLLRNLKIGALLHDIGKFSVPNEIIWKKGNFSKLEKVLFEQHTVMGEEICKPLNSLKACLKIIRCHHEFLDGSGYPDGISGEDIPLEVRIVTVADIFDNRYYKSSTKDGLDLIEINGMLQEKISKGEIDKLVVEALWKVCNKETLNNIYTVEEDFNQYL